MAVHVQEPIHWGRVLVDTDLPALSGSPKEQGQQSHAWLAREFEKYEGVGFERELTWQTDNGEWRYGRCDCFDGRFCYEFKIVRSLPSEPRHRDVEQLQG